MFVGLLCAAMSTSACGVTLRAQEGFARVDDDHDDRRVASADGVVVGVRVMRDRPEASVDFWIRAVDEPDGDPMTTKTAAGMRGVLLRYVEPVGGRPHRYWATLFVRPGGCAPRRQGAGKAQRIPWLGIWSVGKLRLRLATRRATEPVVSLNHPPRVARALPDVGPVGFVSSMLG
jgi:hypothetical protein